MKILHISTRLIIGGSQENTLLSCEGQSRLGHEVHLAYGPIHGPEGSMLGRAQAFKTEDGRGITRHEVPSLVREVSPGADLKCLRELRALIRRVQPDIVHTHSSKAGVLGRAAAWKEGGRAGRIGVVHTVHGPPFHAHESTLNNFIYTEAERWAAKRCHRIVCVCETMKTQFLASRIGRFEKYDVVYSGIDLAPFAHPVRPDERAARRAELGIAPDDVVIGTVARLAHLKGHDEILEAIGDDLRANPRWRLLWVGDGFLRDELENRLRAAGAIDRTIITGMVSPERAAELLRAMDVLVHPSRREGLPRVVPQAMLAGIPVVAYDTDGTWEVCVDMTTGRLVNPNDPKGFREAIRWSIENPEKARALAAEGRRRCLEMFDARRMIDALEVVYTRARA